MGTHPSILKLDLPPEAALGQVIKLFRRAGFSVLTTFDLERARCAGSACPCEYHGSEQCSLQMVVLLVYAVGGGPVTLIAHGDDQKTEFSLVNTPEQPVEPGLEQSIRACLPGVEQPVSAGQA